MKCLCFLLAFFASVFLSGHLAAQKTITLSDIFENGVFRTLSVHGFNWMNDGSYYTVRDGNRIVKFAVATGQAIDTVFDGDKAAAPPFTAYSFSADEQQILLATAVNPRYRRSFSAEYYVYSKATGQVKALSQHGPQSYAGFSPDGSRVAFVRDNNLFYVTLENMAETQVTANGKANSFINGSADWVYEEEFSLSRAFFWSPDAKHLAFLTFDESAVAEYNMQLWPENGNYPQDYRYKYPKAGEANAVPGLAVHHLATGKTVAIDTGTDPDIYLPRVYWAKPGMLFFIRMNRLQNKLELIRADVATGKTETVLTEESDTYVHLNFTDELQFLPDGKHFVRTSEQDGFKHLYLHTLDGGTVRQVTKGPWEVSSLAGVDVSGKQPLFYYVSTEDSPLQRQFYSITADGKTKTRLSAKAGHCAVDMSPDAKYYVLTHSSAGTPASQMLFQTKGNRLVKTLEDNQSLKTNAAGYGFSQKEFFSFNTPAGTPLNGYMLKPANFNENSQYPVLMFQYSGPGSQQVLDNWGGGHFEWHQMLAQQGYLIAVVDGRGTGGRGAVFKKQTYGQLGKLETEDQIATARYLGGLPFVNAARIGIWGWSYGGYMSSLSMMLGADVFKAGIAVAPVTTWRFYDTIYTERYLKRPQDNPGGYDDNSPITHAGKLKGNFLLVHGTADDNVHFQNAVVLQNALIKAGKQFESFYYPGRNHGIGGGNTRMHLFGMMTRFVLEKL